MTPRTKSTSASLTSRHTASLIQTPWGRAELSGLVFKRLGQFVGELEALHPMRAAWIKPRYRNAKAHFEQTKRTGWMPH